MCVINRENRLFYWGTPSFLDRGMPRHIPDYLDAYAGWNAFSSFGPYVFVIGIFCFFVVIFLTLTSENLNNTIDRLIYYANQLMNSAKKKYTIVEKEALAMIYDVKKFRHYLLGNFYFYFVHHKTLLYLVNNPTI
jgi:heme/copper-type cytochrome/quinol oxidase subunit 1